MEYKSEFLDGLINEFGSFSFPEIVRIGSGAHESVRNYSLEKLIDLEREARPDKSEEQARKEVTLKN